MSRRPRPGHPNPSIRRRPAKTRARWCRSRPSSLTAIAVAATAALVWTRTPAAKDPGTPSIRRLTTPERVQRGPLALAGRPRRRLCLGRDGQPGAVPGRARERQRRDGAHERRGAEHAAGVVAGRPVDRVPLAQARRHLDRAVHGRRAAAGRGVRIGPCLVSSRRRAGLHIRRGRDGVAVRAVARAEGRNGPPRADALRQAGRRPPRAVLVARRPPHRLHRLAGRMDERDLDHRRAGGRDAPRRCRARRRGSGFRARRSVDLLGRHEPRRQRPPLAPRDRGRRHAARQRRSGRSARRRHRQRRVAVGERRDRVRSRHRGQQPLGGGCRSGRRGARTAPVDRRRRAQHGSRLLVRRTHRVLSDVRRLAAVGVADARGRDRARAARRRPGSLEPAVGFGRAAACSSAAAR